MRQTQTIVILKWLVDSMHITKKKHCLNFLCRNELPVIRAARSNRTEHKTLQRNWRERVCKSRGWNEVRTRDVRRQFEYKYPTRRECQPDSSTRENRLPRALLSAHFVRHRQQPRSPERPDPPIAPFDIVHGVPTFVLSCLTYVHTHFTVHLLLCVYYVCARFYPRFSTKRMDLEMYVVLSFFF